LWSSQERGKNERDDIKRKMKVDVIYNKSSQRMDELPDESIDCILTSCPYWSLRDYGEDVKEIWGGDSDCEHEWIEQERWLHRGSTKLKNFSRSLNNAKATSAFCLKCGAWYGQLGLEPTLEMYIEHLLLITLECKRVLKPTGVMWWNHGDSYFTGKGSCRNPGGGNKSWKSWNDRKGIFPRGRAAPNRMSKELPPKCLALQNYRLVIRMIDEQGWILRNAAIWDKPNGMPSSVKDRLANKYEPVFCLIKNTKPQYYWNEKTALMADRKPSKAEQIEGIDWEWRECPRCEGMCKVKEDVEALSAEGDEYIEQVKGEVCSRCKGTGKIKYSFWHNLGYWYDLDAIREPHKYSPENRKGGVKKKVAPKGPNQASYNRLYRLNMAEQEMFHPAGRNPGDVWIIPTQPCPEAHFATFPDALCIRPILATCPLEICKKCGKARVRITKSKFTAHTGTTQSQYREGTSANRLALIRQAAREAGGEYENERETIGWTDCGCGVGWDSGVLLDLFAGKGTALIMAKKMGRHYVGYELKKEYCEKLIKPALEEIDPLFNWKTPSPSAG